MRITRVSTRVVDAGDRDWIFVRVDTDESGLFGWGEASLAWHTRAVCGAVGDLELLLVGRDPRPVERLWQLMVRAPFFKGGATMMSAVAGIDQALWDIKAKALGVPLFELLGGPVRDRVRTYKNLGSALGGDPDAMGREAWADAAHSAREGGFDAMKVYPAPATRSIEGAPWLRSIEGIVAAVREVAGDDADIMVDLHGRTTPAMAIQLARAISPQHPWFIEEPCQPGNVEAMVEVTRAVDVPIATGERLITGNEFRELLEKRACAIIQPDVCYCGGISQLRRIAAMAEPYFVTVAPHNPNGPIATMVSVHLALAIPNFLILECVRDDLPWRRDIVDEAFETRDGYVDPPSRPGIGVELVEKVAAAYPGKSPPPHVTLGPDGEIVDW